MKEPVEELRSMIDGIVVNIAQAEEAIALWKEISINGTAINESGYGQLFGRLQDILGKHSIITACRLFEPPNERYELLSLPVVLHHIRLTAEYLTITNRGFVIGKMVEFGHDANQFEGIPDPWITQLVRKSFEEKLPDRAKSGPNELSEALHRLKLARDRRIAHNERVPESAEFIVDETDVKRLLDVAREFVVIVGHGYLNTIYEFDDGRYSLDTDAQTAGRGLRRLLTQAGIIEKL